MNVYLVSCVKQKRYERCAAAGLYISPWFKMAGELARRHSDEWYILSAKHGLLWPESVIDPYEQSLRYASAAELADWGNFVCAQMDRLRLCGDSLTIFAGVNYRRHLMDFAATNFDNVHVPMAGLPIGRQLSWLKQRVATNGQE